MLLSQWRALTVRAAIALGVGSLVFLAAVTLGLGLAFGTGSKVAPVGEIKILLAVSISMLLAGYVTAWIGGRQEAVCGVGLWLALVLFEIIATKGRGLQRVEIDHTHAWLTALAAAAGGGWLRGLVRRRREVSGRL